MGWLKDLTGSVSGYAFCGSPRTPSQNMNMSHGTRLTQMLYSRGLFGTGRLGSYETLYNVVLLGAVPPGIHSDMEVQVI